jgi:hypothetical protein
LLKRQLEERQKHEAILWKQKSRVQWLKEGEWNKKFFHKSMMHKRYINCITKLEDDQGNLIPDHESLEDELINYYQKPLTEPPVDRTPTINRVIQHIPTLITPDQNQALM